MKRFVLTILSVFLFLFLSAGCKAVEPSTPAPSTKPGEPDAVSSSTMKRYRESEIQEYKGMRLDPAIGPRDNSISGVQKVDMKKYTLTVDGLVERPQQLKYEDVKKFDAYERLITLYCVEGWEATILWKGVLLKELIDSAGAKKEAVTVIFHAADGYTTSLPLETVLSKELILAYQANGLDLPAEMGYPFIVVAEDKLGYKWARWVTRIELSGDADYKGYWEERGYDNNADTRE